MIWLLLSLAGDDALLINGGARTTSSRNVIVRIDPARTDPGWAVTFGPALDSPPAWRPLTPEMSFELNGGDGEKVLFGWLRDPAGRQSGPLRASIVLDTRPPQAKATAPAQARPGTIVVMSDVADAVAMQISEDALAGGEWRPYAQPTTYEMSPGQGVKTIIVRYRDEAGNVSDALILSVDVREDAPLIETSSEVRSVRVAPLAGRRDLLLILEAAGMREMQVRIDDAEPHPREPYSSRRLLNLETSTGAHRVRIRLWDQLDAEHGAELAFQEQELGQLVPEPDPSIGSWFMTLKAGVVLNTLEFDALTSIGPRELKAGTLGVARVEVGAQLVDAFFAVMALEMGQGDEVQVLTGEVGVGYRTAAGKILSGDLALEAQLGVLVSSLDVETSNFGDFDPGIGVRLSAGAQLRVSESLWATLALDFREVDYDWSDDVVSGDQAAQGRGLGVTAGLSFRF